jgi:hypothetical protein
VPDTENPALSVPGQPGPVPSAGGLPANGGELGDIATDIAPTVLVPPVATNVVGLKLIDAIVCDGIDPFATPPPNSRRACAGNATSANKRGASSHRIMGRTC